ncbi:hypothetical protein [Rufibacter sp. LB8]|uniref:hypothetical protein n=1 Tax=Rufibacter sp. LB8 TaxID=2777781 RepID=UPI00178C7030|nr:hypothetical protein [Rufibacter sp. LB8]
MKKITLAAALTVAFTVLTAVGLSAQTPYAFPVRPGTEAWKTLKTHREKVAVSQIPQHALRRLSTPDLIASLLDYPLLVDMFLFNGYREGFTTMTTRFNGFQELQGRKDLGPALLKAYRRHRPSIFKNASPEEMGRQALLLTAMEMTVADDRILSKVGQREKEALLREVLAVKAEKERGGPTFGGRARLVSAYCAASLLTSLPRPQSRMADAAGYARMKALVARMEAADPTIPDLVFREAAEYLKSL